MKPMRTLAVAGSVLAVPSAALAAADTDTTGRDALRPSGKLVHDTELKAPLVRANARLARQLGRRPNLRRLRTLPVSVLRERNRRLRERVERLTPATPAPLQAIAACESGGDPSAIGGGGQYRGKYQFSTSTWASVGGSGDPAAASEAEQDRRAAMLYARTGPASWPVCGR
jgi:hypothetical protein